MQKRPEVKYDIPPGATSRKCRDEACGKEIYFVMTVAKPRGMPVDPDGTPHWATCPGAAKFRGEARARDRERVHELKVFPPYFRATAELRKTFEVRQSKDRDFRVGDTLVLKEFSDGAYTGGELRAEVTYVLHGGVFGIPADTYVMALKLTSIKHAD